MEFGFTLKPDVALERAGALAALAERNGFTYGWIFDSHVLWKEPYVPLTLMAQATKTMRLGTCVTNPATREPSVTASTLATLQILSGGRFDLASAAATPHGACSASHRRRSLSSRRRQT